MDLIKPIIHDINSLAISILIAAIIIFAIAAIIQVFKGQ